MSKYIDTINKWDDVAKRGDIAAIHPAGRNGKEEFERSGQSDANYILMVCQDLGLNPKELSILDYGCGLGRVSFPLCQYFHTVYGYDSSFNAMEELANREYPINFFHVFDKLDIENSQPIDVALSLSVFIHHTYEDGVKMMQEVADMVKPGGYLLLQIPIYDLAKDPSNWTDVGVWDVGLFKSAAYKCGLEYIDIHTNPGSFSFSKIGPNHHKLQILKKYE